jgi:hypothetical protein
MAQCAVEGAIWGAKDLGVDAGEVAAAAARGALDAARALGPGEENDVRRSLAGVIDGVTIEPGS